MLVTTNGQQTLWETILPPGYQDLPDELAAVDGLLDDPAFFEPYRAHFSPLFGRPSIPIETYLRMMFSSTGTGWATRACAGRSPTRSAGRGSAGSRWVARCRTPRPWARSLLGAVRR